MAVLAHIQACVSGCLTWPPLVPPGFQLCAWPRGEINADEAKRHLVGAALSSAPRRKPQAMFSHCLQVDATGRGPFRAIGPLGHVPVPLSRGD